MNAHSDMSKDPKNPSHPHHTYYDVCNRNDPRPPKGTNLLILNEGGVCIPATYGPKVRYWTYKPDVPKDPAPEDFISLNKV